jgi:hypothetical protein
MIVFKGLETQGWEPIEFMKAMTIFEEKGDTTALHSLFNDRTGSLHATGRATLTKIMCALADRDFTEAEKILAVEPQPEFDAIGQRRCYEIRVRLFTLFFPLRRGRPESSAIVFQEQRAFQ